MTAVVKLQLLETAERLKVTNHSFAEYTQTSLILVGKVEDGKHAHNDCFIILLATSTAEDDCE